MVKIGINGFGRIGRLVARIMMERGNYEIVAINYILNPKDYAKSVKQMKDQLAIEPPRKRQSTTVQSPEPRKIIGMARLKA